MLPLHDFEKALFFEGCLPIEELARRGVDTLRYGPMKPVGLTAPDGRRPWAVVQLRQENLAKSQLQPGRLPVAHEVGRSAARAADDPRPRAGASSCASARSTATPSSTRPRHLDRYYRRAAPRRACASPGRSPASRAISSRRRPASRSALYLSLERARRDARAVPADHRARRAGPPPDRVRPAATSSRPTSTTACSSRSRPAPARATAAPPSPSAPDRALIGVGGRSRAGGRMRRGWRWRRRSRRARELPCGA